MNIKLTSIKKGEFVEVSADIYEKEDNRRGSEYALTAEPAKFSYKRTLFTRDEGPVLLTLPVKEARQFARKLLALTRQDGDVENEREQEIRELKEDRDRWQERAGAAAKLREQLEAEIKTLTAVAGLKGGSKDAR